MPDFDYREEVTVILPAPPSAAATTTMPPPLLSALAIAQRYQAIQEALDRIGAKILGARIDGADDAVRVQLAAYRSTLTMLRWAARSVPAVVAEVLAAAAADPRFSPADADEAFDRVRRDGLPPALRELAASAGMPPDTVDRLQELVATQTAPVDLAATTRQLGSALTRLADVIQTDADEILLDQPSS